MCLRKVGVNLNRFVVIAQRIVILTLLLVGDTSSHVYVRVPFDEEQDFVETVDGLLEIVELQVDNSDVETTNLEVFVQS